MKLDPYKKDKEFIDEWAEIINLFSDMQEDVTEKSPQMEHTIAELVTTRQTEEYLQSSKDNWKEQLRICIIYTKR